jgi:Protein of unknown function (DUF3738)
MEMERTMASLAQQLTPMLDSPVVDHTGLKGAYTIGLDLSLQNCTKSGGHPPIAGVPIGGPVPARKAGLVIGGRFSRFIDNQYVQRSLARVELQANLL